MTSAAAGQDVLRRTVPDTPPPAGRPSPHVLALLATLALSPGCGYLGLAALLGSSGGGGGTRAVASGALFVAVGRADPSASSEANSATGVVMAQLALTAAGEEIRVTRLVVAGEGTGIEPTDLSAVSLYLDADGDGAVDGGSSPLASSLRYLVDDGVVEAQGFSVAIPAGATRFLLVVYDLNGAGAWGSTFRVKLRTAADLTATSASGRAVPVLLASGAQLTFGLHTLSTTGSLSLDVDDGSPSGRLVSPGETDVLAFPVLLRTGSAERVQVTGLNFHGSGTGDDQSGLSAVRLYSDDDGDGRISGGTDTLLAGPETYTADDGLVSFELSPGVTLERGQSVRWLAAYDFSSGASPGETFMARVVAASDVSAFGDNSGGSASVSLRTLPLEGPTLAVLPPPEHYVVAGPHPPADATAAAGMTQVKAVQLRLAASGGSDLVLSQLTLTAEGSGEPQVHLSAVELWPDADEDGLVDAGSPRIAGPVTVTTSDRTATFSGFSHTVTAGQTRSVIVTVSLGAGAEQGTTYRLVLVDPEHATVGPGGAMPVGPPVSGATITVGP